MKKAVGIGGYSPDVMNFSCNINGDKDINRGELAAIYAGLLFMPVGRKNIDVFSDSLTAIHLLDGKFQNSKYNCLVKCIKYVADMKYNGNVHYLKVKAHSSVWGNEVADSLARYGSVKEHLPFHVPEHGDNIINLVHQSVHINSLIHDVILSL